MDAQRQRPDQSVKFFTKSEMSRLLQASRVSPRDFAILLLTYRHGLRAGEVGMIRLSDLDLSSNSFAPYRQKGCVQVCNPIGKDEVAAIKAYLATKERKSRQSDFLFLSCFGTPIEKRSLDRMIKHYGKKAGLSPAKLHMHCLKHSIATHIYEATGDVYAVKDWLGHRSVESTAVYATLTVGRKRELAKKTAKFLAR